MDVDRLRNLVSSKSGHAPETTDERAIAPIRELLKHTDVEEYARFCLPGKTYRVCGSAVQCLGDIIGEMHPEAAPGGWIGSYGYLIIASSAGGNAVCLQSSTGKVFWADHESFADDSIGYQNRSTGDWVFFEEYSAERVEEAMVPLSESLEEFLTALLTDQLEETLDSLD
jgi:hypothetical protein